MPGARRESPSVEFLRRVVACHLPLHPSCAARLFAARATPSIAIQCNDLRFVA
jgi:hypothetical protein